MQQEPNQDKHDSADDSQGLFNSTSSIGGPIGSNVSGQDERTWSALAHLSILLWLVTGPVSFFFALTLVLLPAAPLVLVAPPLILWLVYKDKSPKVRFHAAQSFWYQVAWVVVSFVLGMIGFVLTLLSLGLALVFLLPLGLAIGLVPFAHQCYAAYKVNQGVDYRYPLIADLVDGGHRSG